MKQCRFVRLWCLSIVWLWVGSACKGHEVTKHAESPATAAPQASDSPSVSDENKNLVPSKPDAVRTATEWLGALRERDRAKLQKFADVPLELQELVQYPKCESKLADKREDVPSALACLLSDDLLMEALAAQPAPVTEAVGASDLPPWAAKLKEGSYAGQLVQVRLPGDGVSYQFVLLITKAGVRRVWKFAEYDPN